MTDDLIGRADALMRGDGIVRSKDVSDDDDLPLLIDVVADDAATSTPTPAPNAAATPTAPPEAMSVQLEHLPDAVEQQIEHWLELALPGIIRQELDMLAERISLQALDSMRSELLPRLRGELLRAFGHRPDEPDRPV